MQRFGLAAALAVATLTPTEARALAVPELVTHQGRLFDTTGSPVSGTQDLTFTIYDAELAGNELWSETITVDFDEGYFSVRLGEQWSSTRTSSTAPPAGSASPSAPTRR
ncbi:hypothetical protein OV079_23040 [Nannocystis pusilla]|uniref:Uncharacterized protein n=1 Tax=Nannocystis pusilla TaxID=889268 RepID=A0A9X3ES55_9BACT|nr:hypothetical protein [Nannocystis pusilla]MCY1008379.1 hypothetical protein [Nannocystis pusilla]